MTTTAPDTLTIGRKLVELCREGKNLEAVEQLYSPDIVSVEATGGMEFDQTTKGIEGVRAKNSWWLENNEVHDHEICGPFPHGDRFAVGLKYEITPKAGPIAGNRFTMEEIGLYTVAGGKIVKEEYFYDMGG